MAIRPTTLKRQRMATKQPVSRADVVRTRRPNILEEHTVKKVERIKQSSASVPVITMRNGMMGTPMVQRASQRPRLKLNVPLNRKGVEMRLPAIPMIRPSWRMLSGSLVLLLGILVIYMTTSTEFTVKSPTLKGFNRISSAEIDGALPLSNERIYTIDPQQAEAALQAAFPELKSVSVDVSFPAKVTIQGVERQPVVTWKYQDMAMWIDNEGVLFPAHGDAQTIMTISSDGAPPMVQSLLKPNLLSDVPLDQVSGQTDAQKKEDAKNNQRFVDRNVLNSAILLYQQIPANSTVLYDKNHGLGWLDNAGWNVYVGFNLDQLNQKMLIYQKLVEKLKHDGIHPKMISIEYVNAPFYRLE
jgi:cell division protein FtsQ